MSKTQNKSIDLKDKLIAVYRPFVFFIISVLVTLPLNRFKISLVALIFLVAALTSLMDIFLVTKKSKLWLLSLGLDCLVIAMLIFISGGVESSLSMIYILIILIYTLKRGQKAVWISSATSILTYFVILILHWKGILQIVDKLFHLALYEGEKPISFNFLVVQFSFSAGSVLIISAIAAWMEERSAKKTKQLEYVKYTTDDILRNMDEGVLTTDNLGEIAFVNPPFALYTGYNMLSKGQQIPDEISKIIEEQPEELKLIGIDGLKRILSCRVATMMDLKRRIIGNMIVLHDLTDLREKEKRLNDIKQIALMGEMSAGIAHEIRNPLASIRASVDVLYDDFTPEKKELADIVRSEVSRINNLVEDFLKLSRLPEPKKELTNMNSLIKDVKKLFSISKKGANIEVKTSVSDEYITAEVDRSQIIQVIMNLLNNASDALQKQEEKIISIKLNLQGNQLLIEIQDNGIGISSDNIKKIFNPFYSGSKGTGLGLSIVKKIISHHDGDIWVESELNQGTVFTISIPRGDDEEDEKESPEQPMDKAEISFREWNEM
ncbi:MAG: hypothetical protein APR63_10625 [Desulfuromonas sp. SDB]|nr:MAG: hypothetical protein APR63_10625 [Desulfuromonas sp. SDB]